jgi:hypothetical protein
MTRRLITAVRVSGWVFSTGNEYEFFQHTEFADEHILRFGLHILELEAAYAMNKSQITIANESYTS